MLNLARSVSAGIVSTHSRPKAAGCAQFLQFGSYYGFNTQPPEGGWACNHFFLRFVGSFNTQPPEGGWACLVLVIVGSDNVSTHSRPKAAGLLNHLITHFNYVSTHSRPKAAGGYFKNCLGNG